IRAQGADTLSAEASLRAAVARVTDAPASDTPSVNDALIDLYAQHDWSTLWVADGRPTRQASAVIEFLGNAQQVGLQPDDYDARGLDDWASRIVVAPAGLMETTRFDVSLSRSLLLLIRHL